MPVLEITTGSSGPSGRLGLLDVLVPGVPGEVRIDLVSKPGVPVAVLSGRTADDNLGFRVASFAPAFVRGPDPAGGPPRKKARHPAPHQAGRVEASISCLSRIDFRSTVKQDAAALTRWIISKHEATADALEAVDNLKGAREKILKEVRKVIIGQQQVIDDVLICLFSRGHALLVGVPGLARALLVSTIARILDLNFKRIQFTPDLMPSDITGTDIIEEDPATGRRELTFFPGPIFANIILADEINRTPPKTQAAMMQAMQEKEVTIGTKTYSLDQPFLVLATQNPIEQEGTYPLPEAQLDRFMFNIYVGYPTEDEEVAIGETTTVDSEPELQVVMGAEDILKYQSLVRRVPVARHVSAYATRIARATRPDEPGTSEVAKKWIQWGAGPRAVQNMIIGGKARAILRGSFYVSTEDIRACAQSVLRHRILPNFAAEAEGVDTIAIIKAEGVAFPGPEEARRFHEADRLTVP